MATRVAGLFMEMGLGKTRTAIELLRRRQHRIDHVVWCCPVSLKETIAGEWRKHTTIADTAIYVFDDTTSERTCPQVPVYIVGLESISSSRRVVLTLNSLITSRSCVVVDESSYIKGHRAARTQRITLMSERARYRLILTGTPLSQGVEDLFAQMRFLSPQILGYRSFYSFANNHLEYSTKHRGLIVRAHNTGLLASKIAPYVYQVTKAEVLDLPKKIAAQRYVRLRTEQRIAYQQAKEELLLSVEDEEITSYHLFRLFTALQQIVCGFWNRQGERLHFPHDRLAVMLASIGQMPPDARVIIWAKYRQCIEDICGALDPAQTTQWHGGLNERQRAAELDRWRAGARYFVATPSTGGHGITLNEASYVVFYTNGFKYSERIQAEDRCHRIGQNKSVTYVDITAEGTIDDRIQAALARKENLLDSFRRKIDQVKDKSKAEVRRAVADLVREL